MPSKPNPKFESLSKNIYLIPDKSPKDKRDLIPDFSEEIQQSRSDSFFHTGFTVVHRLLFIFLLFFFFLLTIVGIISYLFYVDLKVEGMGILEPSQYQEVRSGLGGIVEKVHVTNGDKVVKGDLLAELSDLEFHLQLAQAKSDLAASQAEMKRRIKKYKLPDGDLDTVHAYTNVRALCSGIVSKVFVYQGQRVRKGQLLAKLIDFENRVQLYQAQKDLDVAKAELKRRIDKYELSYAMYKNLIPELDNAKTFVSIPEIAVQRAIVEKVTRQIDLIENHIDKANIRSPVTGKVLSSDIGDLIGKSVVEGEVLLLVGTEDGVIDNADRCLKNPRTIPEISQQEAHIAKLIYKIQLLENQLEKTRIYAEMDGTIITPDLNRKTGSVINKGETLMRVANLENWRVKAAISERDVPKLKLGDPARIKINAFPFMKFKMFDGIVTDIDYASTPFVNQALIVEKDNDQTPSLYYRITIQLNDTGAFKEGKKIDFQFGLLANVDIIVSKKRIITYLWELFLGKLDFFSNISRQL